MLICYLQEIKSQIRKTIDSQNEDSKNVKHESDDDIKYETVFEEILHSNLPPEELSLSRLHDEALVIITAGIGPARKTMSVACYHVLSNPKIYGQLCQELTNAFPDLATQPTLPELEKLPYLSAVIQECKGFNFLYP